MLSGQSQYKNDLILRAGESPAQQATIEAHSRPAEVDAYIAWFCPFAQRLWIALEYKCVPYRYIETNPYEKTKEFLAINPRGLVPAMLHKGHNIYESVITMEYLDEEFCSTAYPALLPRGDNYARARVRIWTDFVTNRIATLFFRVLQNPKPEEFEKTKHEHAEAWLQFAAEMNAQGPFFLGSELSMVDIAAAPLAVRLPLLDHFRHVDLPSDRSDARVTRLRQWIDAVTAHPAVAATIPSAEPLLRVHHRYAENKADSQVARATRAATTVA